ncbi:hypothetical protein NO2_0771 [Candidatus Termititenax persephonae]|uniref:Uncharacterized protein n=1 Tax=Candidatus Termititenax persephonae TaxID=2218525 RepID=A0A388THJ5_9BACT|nr:hypothetical protein NO2_0771 [Candidatus Termititenax persephonae]
MASPYTGSYTGIAKGERAEAGKMTAALNLLERVANKTDTVTADSTAAQYPSAAAAYTAIAALSGAGLEITDNKVTSTTWGANDNKNSDVKYPTCKAVTASYAGAEHQANRVTTISPLSTDDEYPTVKAVADAILRKMRMYYDFQRASLHGAR